MIRRVVQRHLKAVHRLVAARPLKPEKLAVLMLKVRKWAVSGVKISELAQVLTHLGGWTLEEIYVLAPESAHGPEYVFRHKNPDTTRMVWDQAKEKEVRSLPDPEETHFAAIDLSKASEFLLA